LKWDPKKNNDKTGLENGKNIKKDNQSSQTATNKE
jgi:hypothetical protein